MVGFLCLFVYFLCFEFGCPYQCSYLPGKTRLWNELLRVSRDAKLYSLSWHLAGFVWGRGVRNPMNILDIGFLKTEPNWPQNSKTENSVSAVRFCKKTTITTAFWGRFFTLFHSQFILQHDRINRQSIFLHAVPLHFLFWVTSADN